MDAMCTGLHDTVFCQYFCTRIVNTCQESVCVGVACFFGAWQKDAEQRAIHVEQTTPVSLWGRNPM